METILHALGLCPDHLNHISLYDLWNQIPNLYQVLISYLKKR